MSDPQMNKARCVKCNEIVVSKHLHDHAMCSCGNVSVCGGLVNPIIRASDSSLIRGVEYGEDAIEAKYQGREEKQGCETQQYVTRQQLLDNLDARLCSIRHLPLSGRISSVSHDDLYSWISDISAILRAF